MHYWISFGETGQQVRAGGKVQTMNRKALFLQAFEMVQFWLDHIL